MDLHLIGNILSKKMVDLLIMTNIMLNYFLHLSEVL